jgi:hypothetical protein
MAEKTHSKQKRAAYVRNTQEIRMTESYYLQGILLVWMGTLV